jgi:hypothetical protein
MLQHGLGGASTPRYHGKKSWLFHVPLLYILALTFSIYILQLSLLALVLLLCRILFISSLGCFILISVKLVKKLSC